MSDVHKTIEAVWKIESTRFIAAMRASLSDEALRLGRMLAHLLPGESEVHALVGLMELQASRNAARRGKNGEAVLFPDQGPLPVGLRAGPARADLARKGAGAWRWRETVRVAGRHCRMAPSL